MRPIGMTNDQYPMTRECPMTKSQVPWLAGPCGSLGLGHSLVVGHGSFLLLPALRLCRDNFQLQLQRIAENGQPRGASDGVLGQLLVQIVCAANRVTIKPNNHIAFA